MQSFFSPITAGDSSTYICMAKHWLGESADFDQGAQSPQYGIFFTAFLTIFGNNYYLNFVVYFHFLLIFMTSIIVFRIASRLTHNINLSYLAGFLGDEVIMQDLINRHYNHGCRYFFSGINAGVCRCA